MKPDLVAYAPAVVRGIAANTPDSFGSFLESLDHSIRKAFDPALAEQFRHLAPTKHPEVVRKYLSTLGFTVPECDDACVLRFFDAHREYLRLRGTIAGVALLCWMVIGKRPKVRQNEPPSEPIRLDRKQTGRTHRLHSPAIQYVRLVFERSFKEEERALLHKMLSEDRPLNTIYLICVDPLVHRNVERLT